MFEAVFLIGVEMPLTRVVCVKKANVAKMRMECIE